MALAEGGEVYSFGSGRRAAGKAHGSGGCLGHGDGSFQSLPRLIAALQGKRVVQVSAGGQHSLVLVEGGEVYSFGKGGDGQLGHNDRHLLSLGRGDGLEQLAPKLIATLRGQPVARIAAGHRHSLVLLERGEVYSFGYGGNGQLGHGDHENQLAPKLIASTSTRQGRALEVAAGARWSLLLKEDGDVVTLGGDMTTAEEDSAW